MGIHTNVWKRPLIILMLIILSGCTLVFQKGRRSDFEKITTLDKQVSTLQSELDELAKARSLLEDKLRQEIADKQVSVQMADRGLVITFVADILFDSGKSKIRPEAYSILDKVSKVLVENVPDLNIGIEGHTDNVPIKHSGWKSNWELSSARALSVLHFLVEEKGLEPFRVAAIGYGEFRPVAGNDTQEGRQKNRRVEVVIIPKLSKVGGEDAQVMPSGLPAVSAPAENLK